MVSAVPVSVKKSVPNQPPIPGAELLKPPYQFFNIVRASLNMAPVLGPNNRVLVEGSLAVGTALINSCIRSFLVSLLGNSLYGLMAISNSFI